MSEHVIITFTLKTSHCVILTPDEARELRDRLNELFITDRQTLPANPVPSCPGQWVTYQPPATLPEPVWHGPPPPECIAHCAAKGYDLINDKNF